MPPLPAASDVASVMSDDREMSVSDIHPITFNRRLRRSSSDDGQTAEIKVEKIAGGRCVTRGETGKGKVQVHQGRREQPDNLRRSTSTFTSGVKTDKVKLG